MTALKSISKMVSIHHMLAMGEVILLSRAFRVIKNNIPGISITVVAGSYACNFLKCIPWIDKSVPIESFGINMGKTSKLRRRLSAAFTVPLLYGFLRKHKFDSVFIRDDERIPYTRHIRAAVKLSGIRNVVRLKPLMDKHMNSSRHVLDSYFAILKDLGFTVGMESTDFLVPDNSSIFNAKKYLQRYGISAEKDTIIGLCPTSILKIKGWDYHRIMELIRMFSGHASVKTILFSTDQQYVENVKQSDICPDAVVGKVTFPDLMALIAHCSLFIGVDTGPMHLSASLGIPTIGVFGPTSGKVFGPYGENSSFIQNTPDCPYYKPDSFLSSRSAGFQECYVLDRCLFLKDATCVNLTSANDVYDAAKKLLNY